MRETSDVNQDPVQTEEKIICVKCGAEADPLHLGCRLCEECCDCRPLGT